MISRDALSFACSGSKVVAEAVFLDGKHLEDAACPKA